MSALKRMAGYGFLLENRVRLIGDLEAVPIEPIGRWLGFTDDDVEGFAVLFDILRPLIANAYLTVGPTPEQARQALAAQHEAGTLLSELERSELIVWLHRAEDAALMTEWAKTTLDKWGDWVWNDEKERTTRRPKKGEGNAPRHLFTEAVIQLYDAWHPGDGPGNTVEVRRRISKALRWFFPESERSAERDERIYEAIRRDRRNGPRRR